MLLALPPAALAHTCNDGSCECGEAENGGPKGDGQGNGTEEGEECSECEDEDHNQNDTDTDPVKLWRGSVYNKASQFRPIQAPGQLKTATLAFGLHYASDMSVGGSANYAGPVGNNWTHNYDVRLVVDSASARVYTWNGSEKVFTKELNGTYTGDGSSTLTNNQAGAFIWQLRHGTKYRFDVADQYRLTHISNRNDIAVELKYDQNGRLTNVTDTAGRQLTIYNDGNGRVQDVVDPLGRTNSYRYDHLGRLTNIFDGLGSRGTYEYDGSSDRLAKFVNARGKAHSYTYDVLGKVVRETNALGQVTYYDRDPVSGSVTVNNWKGHTFTVQNNGVGKFTGWTTAAGSSAFDRDAAGRVTQKTSRAGRISKFEYAPTACSCGVNGGITVREDALGRVQQFDYHPVFNFRTAFTNASGAVRRWGYDHRGNRTNEINAHGYETKFVADAVGNRTQHIDPYNKTNFYTYDPTGNLTNATDALGRVTRFQYDLVGRLTNRVDAMNRTNHYFYDDRDRLTKQVNALGYSDTWTYDGENHVLGHTNALGHATSYTYNDAGLKASLKLPGGSSAFETYAYDANRNRIAVTNALEQVTRYGYDEDDHLTAITNALNYAWLFAYDALGRRTNSVNPNNHTNSYSYDAASQLLGVTNALNQVVRFEYDLVGNRTNLIDAKNQAVGFSYDPLNRLTNIYYGASDTERFQYDPTGNLTNYIARSGDTIRFGYDAANRLISKVVDGPYQESSSYDYDAASRLELIASDTLGGTNRLEFTYDAAGRITNETSLFIMGGALSVGYEYDASGRRSKLTYPDSTFITYEYNTNGWLTSISDGGTNAIVTYEYDSAGRRIGRTLQNSTFTVLDYDAAGQVTNIHHQVTTGGGSTTLSRYQYGYDPAGNRLWVKRANGKGDVYKYDPIDQLTNVLYEASNPDTSPGTWTNEARFVFDAAGNRSSVTYTNTGTQSYSVNGLNQYTDLGGMSLGYDANGNMASFDPGPYIEFYYDTENRLREAYGEDWDAYGWYYYDGLGRLAGLEAGSSGITRFVYDSEWRLLAEYDETIGNTVLLAKYVYGPEIDEPLRMERGGQKYYYHAAALGTVTEITDDTGALVEQYRYDVYGEPEFRNGSGTPLTGSAIGNRLLFQGRDRDPATGLYNFRYRYYSPALGRFLQPDPIGKPQFEASRVSSTIRQNETVSVGLTVDESYRVTNVDPDDTNLYRFVHNQPPNASDSHGLMRVRIPQPPNLPGNPLPPTKPNIPGPSNEIAVSYKKIICACTQKSEPDALECHTVCSYLTQGLKEAMTVCMAECSTCWGKL